MIALETQRNMPLYEQLYAALAADIKSGALTPGSALPGRRSMAARLGVSVSTVDSAYQMLAAEGLVLSEQRRGFFVQETGGLLHNRPTQHAQANAAPGAQEGVGTGTQKEPISAADDGSSQTASARYQYDLSTGSVDTALFPISGWARIQRDLLYKDPSLLQRGEMQGEWDLRTQIAAYLSEYRGVIGSADQIIVGAGIEYLLGCLAHLFAHRTVAIENPGYLRTRAVLQNSGIACLPVSIDEDGLSVTALQACGADLCYVTPSHHFPTGVTMPARRRAQLLSWAADEPDRWILEDDYDSEFRFDTKPLPSLQGMAGPDANVVYLTTFSKSLAPGIRIACMVLPQKLLAVYQRDFAVYANTVSRVEQMTLCRFMASGQFSRHIARMRLAYKRRMEHFAVALHKNLGDGLTLRATHSGLHFLLTYPGAGGEGAMVAAAAAEGVRLRGLGAYYMTDYESCTPDTVVAGYAALREEDIDAVAAALARAWRR